MFANEYEWSRDVDAILKTKFKFEQFKPLQLQVINAVLNKCDAIVLMHTGYGKSLTYQIPAMIQSPQFKNKITVVFSPLVACT